VPEDRPSPPTAARPWPVVHFAGEDDIVFPAGRWDRTLEDFELVVNLGEGVTLEVAGERHVLRPGDAFVLRPGEPHALSFDGVHRVGLLFCHHRWEGLERDRPGTVPNPWRWPSYMPAGEHSARLIALLRDLLTALWRRTGPWQWEASVALLGAAAICERLAASAPPFPQVVPVEPAPVRAARAFLEQHLGRQTRGLVAGAARAAGLSRSQLNRAFHAAYGMSPQRWIHGLRLARACTTLVQRRADVQTAARAAGFDDARSFSRFFRRHTGLPPTAYRTRYTGLGHPVGQPPLPQPFPERWTARPYPCNVHLPGA
jgi:AraC-like DNA-binding protein